MPRTFEDATATTRCLGYRFLWNNDLCIAQEDDGEWLPESAKMGNISRNSVCTIAVTAVECVHKAFFTERPTPKSLVQPCLVEDTGPDSKMRFAVIHLSQPRSQLAVNAGPLKDRSCVLQERALFPRIVPKQPTVSSGSVVS